MNRHPDHQNPRTHLGRFPSGNLLTLMSCDRDEASYLYDRERLKPLLAVGAKVSPHFEFDDQAPCPDQVATRRWTRDAVT